MSTPSSVYNINNLPSSDPNQQSMDGVRANVEHFLRESYRKQFTPDITRGVIYYQAQVLRCEQELDISANQTFLGKLVSSLFKPETKLRSFKCRVPELHPHIPIPEVFGKAPTDASDDDFIKKFVKSKLIIDAYPTYKEFNLAKPENSNITEGDLVWIIYGNSVTFDNPYIVGKVATDSTDVSSAGSTNSKGLGGTSNMTGVVKSTDGKTLTQNKKLSPEIKALLDTIANTESGGADLPYDKGYAGYTITNFSDHPQISEKWNGNVIVSGVNKGKLSTAAGRYQFMGFTWREIKTKHNLADFQPENQDAGAWYLAAAAIGGSPSSAESTLKSSIGDVNTFTAKITSKIKNTWTSMPGSNTGEGVRNSPSAVYENYKKFLEAEKKAVPSV